MSEIKLPNNPKMRKIMSLPSLPDNLDLSQILKNNFPIPLYENIVSVMTAPPKILTISAPKNVIIGINEFLKICLI